MTRRTSRSSAPRSPPTTAAGSETNPTICPTETTNTPTRSSSAATASNELAQRESHDDETDTYDRPGALPSPRAPGNRRRADHDRAGPGERALALRPADVARGDRHD